MRYEEKMKSLTYSKNPSFEMELGKLYCSVIQKKIVFEYVASFSYLSPTQEFVGSSVFMLQSSNPQQKRNHSINKLTNFCACLKVSHIGIPCSTCLLYGNTWVMI